MHLQTITEVLQSIKASDMTPMLQRIYASEGGSDVLDTLMKYLYAFPIPPPFPSRRALLPSNIDNDNSPTPERTVR